MLDFILDALKPRLAVLAEAWLSTGAASFGLWENDRPLARWPAHADGPPEGVASLVMPIRAGGPAQLELRIAGAEGSLAQDRLRCDASLVGEVIHLECELENMTARLIETQDQLLALYDLTHAARSHLNMRDTLNSLAGEAARLLMAAGAFAILALPDETPIVAQQPIPRLSSRQILRIFNQMQADQQELMVSIELGSEATRGSGAKSSLFVMPILVRGQVVAALGLLNKTAEPFASPDMKLAVAIAEQGGGQMENVLLLQEALAQARIQTEMELAQRVQHRLLPQKLPLVAGLDIAARSRPALQVGGDFYDFICRPGWPFTFAVGDVSGKGMGAALVMSMTHTTIRGIGSRAPQPTAAAIAAETNAHLYDDLTEIGAFASMFVGQFDHATCLLGFANAGHSPVIYCPHGGLARLLEADSPPIGVLPISLCEDHVLPMQPGDLLVVATDGFSEAHNASGEMFGYERLLRLTEALQKLPAPTFLNAIFTAVESFSAGHPQDDDQTAVVLKGVPG